ncbi:hypothetical protein O6H91_23G031800 [Diphasiastrum complanatum]|uniref:Uncharacterized protein n=2 Tax=Diphasiastrum complanatum TaxID=34168 RepID=A0ACC2A9I6_DIPCM|nr:hypothetical protein O6H91_23G031800 [Diphasiastrum complanatum]KAJ7514178.1 hypothetical protein O6H91_23G031800 [Diphasiastrum complanatum]
MYSGQGYGDGGSLFGGGGFMPSQSTTAAADSPFSSRKSGSQSSGLLPLTVKQISGATQKPSDDNFYVDGQDVNHVTLVGMVFNREERATDISFLVDDGTGRIEVKRWIDGQDTNESMEMNSVQNGVYVRVHGHLRSFQGKRNVVAFSVRLITDFNEVTFHFLECIYVHVSNLKSQRGVNPSHVPQSTNTFGGPGIHTLPPTLGSMAQNSSYNQYMPSTTMAGSGLPVDECQKRVHAIFEEPASLGIEIGLHVDDVARRMVGYTKKQVKDAIDFLVNEGFIYSTIDDDHFKSTNA